MSCHMGNGATQHYLGDTATQAKLDGDYIGGKFPFNRAQRRAVKQLTSPPPPPFSCFHSRL